jgi:hypothetical protein
MVVTVDSTVDLLQERLLEVSDEIMRELSRLERNIEAVPAEGRASLLMAVMQITATQRSLRAHTDRLPHAWQRLDALRATLEMLEATLEHLWNIENVHLSPGQPPAAPRALMSRRRDLRAGRHAERQGLVAKSLERSRNVLNGAWLRLLGLLVMLLAGAAISYGMFPQASQRGPEANSTGTAAAAGDGVAVSATPPSREAIERPVPLPVSPPTAGQVTEAPAAVRSEDPRPAPTGRAGGMASGMDWPMPGMVVAMQPSSAPSPRVLRGAGEATASELQVARATERDTAIPPTGSGSEGFVPVVFTHKDGGVARRAFADLQRQYPKLLGHRRGEPQPVDLGSKGVWHRLVVLPAGSRSDATRFCDRLVTAGYDRCWVKAY